MDDSEIIKNIEQLINDLTLIPRGSFLMGSPKEDKDTYAYKSELPQHLVYIQSSLISKYPVTQLQWKVISYLSKVDIELPTNISEFKGNNLPVESITWCQALEFCNRLSAFTGQNITLPSEAQWEYACKAGTTTRYYWGDNPNSKLANYNWDPDRPTPVGSYPPNSWGLYDMYGNVAEYCLDTWHSNYEGVPNDGSPWLHGNKDYRTIRGGSWCDYSIRCNSNSRSGVYSMGSFSDIGFRICCSI